MIKQGDRVRILSSGEWLARDVIAPTPRGALVRIGGNELELHASDLTLLCGIVEEGAPCPRDAELFVRADQRPICPVHARAFPPAMLADTRIEESALVSCACGASLDNAPSAGVWTLAGIACEYRTCRHCGSSRAYMAADSVRGRVVHLYADPHSSEIDDEADTFLEALELEPPHERAVLMRNGVVLARAFRAVNGEIGWYVQKPERETPLAL